MNRNHRIYLNHVTFYWALPGGDDDDDDDDDDDAGDDDAEIDVSDSCGDQYRDSSYDFLILFRYTHYDQSCFQ